MVDIGRAGGFRRSGDSPGQRRDNARHEPTHSVPLSFTRLLSRLDPDPVRRGREFERICLWYLRNAPEYRSRLRKVWLWSDWPDAWAADAGIDLVAEEHDGDLWAIQAKAYDERYPIKKADVDSFLSESSRPGSPIGC
jgi:predicted helicase